MSPVSLANKKSEPPESKAPLLIRPTLAKTATEVTGIRRRSSELSAFVEGDAAEAEIDATFRRVIAGLRRLPPRDRPHAFRTAKEAHSAALKTLREKRARERAADRAAERILRKFLEQPEPS